MTTTTEPTRLPYEECSTGDHAHVALGESCPRCHEPTRRRYLVTCINLGSGRRTVHDVLARSRYLALVKGLPLHGWDASYARRMAVSHDGEQSTTWKGPEGLTMARVEIA